MDHLPEIQNSAYPSPTIPCLCRPQDYDGHGVRDFPSRTGWEIDIEKGPIRIADQEPLIKSPRALLQTWLYFGTLHEVLSIGGLDVNMQSFVETVDDESVVTSRPLRGYLDQLAQYAETMAEEEYQRRQERVRDCLRVISHVLDLHWDPMFSSRRWSILPCLPLDVVMSIQILLETLKDTLGRIWPVTANPSPLEKAYTRRTVNPLRSRLLERGWCPNETKLLFDGLDHTGMHLASLLRRPFAQGLSHEMCNDDECLALQTSESDYQTVHVDDCPGGMSCTNVVIDQSKISTILRMGGIPIIYVSIIPEDGSAPKVRVLDFNSNQVNYIAYSHVWAHGLGNPQENALPSCQVLRLKYLSAALNRSRVREPAFWIDTLCIPVAQEYKMFRKVAIGRLATTFREASHVIVLDADLQRTSIDGSATELATRVMCSGWIRRLWTLQEAVMSSEQEAAAKVNNATKVNIQFLEGTMQLNEILRGRHIKARYHADTAIVNITNAFPQFRTRDRTFNVLVHSLRYRTTSRKEDEAICLASILGLNQYEMSQILNEGSAEARMQKLYTLIAHIPASILFNCFRKLVHEGAFRWAPASLLSVPSSRSNFKGPSARCDARGLHVQFAGLVIKGIPTYGPEPYDYSKNWMVREFPIGSYYIGDPAEATPRGRITIELTELGESEKSPYSAFADGLHWMTQRSTRQHNECVTLDRWLRYTEKPAIVINPQDSFEHVLVSVTDEQEPGVIEAVWMSRIILVDYRKRRSYDIDYSHHRDWKRHRIDVQEVGESQLWCIK